MKAVKTIKRVCQGHCLVASSPWDDLTLWDFLVHILPAPLACHAKIMKITHVHILFFGPQLEIRFLDSPEMLF